MSHKPCVLEPLVMSKYCRLFFCPDCGTVHFNLPCQVSMQFEVCRFLGIADAFLEAAKMLRGQSEASSAQVEAERAELQSTH